MVLLIIKRLVESGKFLKSILRGGLCAYPKMAVHPFPGNNVDDLKKGGF
jgi:hypothetical protein